MGQEVCERDGGRAVMLRRLFGRIVSLDFQTLSCFLSKEAIDFFLDERVEKSIERVV